MKLPREITCGTIVLLVLVVLAGLTGCESRAAEQGRIPTLSTSKELPGTEIKEYITHETWQQLSGMPIERYVGIYATIKPDGSLALANVFAAYPDHTWDNAARNFGKGVLLNYTSLVGTQLPPRAEVYVIFFEEVGGERPVAIYSYQTDTDPSRGEGNTFSGKRINDEGRFQEWARRPQNFQLTVY